MLVAPGPRVDMQMPGLPVMSPQVEASMAPATSCFISRKRIWRWRAASISSTDSPPGCPTMKGVPASLNAVASTSTVVDIPLGLSGFRLRRQRSTIARSFRGDARRRTPDQTAAWIPGSREGARPGMTDLLHDLELVHAAAAVLVDVDVALGVDRDAVRL